MEFGLSSTPNDEHYEAAIAQLASSISFQPLFIIYLFSYTNLVSIYKNYFNHLKLMQIKGHDYPKLLRVINL